MVNIIGKIALVTGGGSGIGKAVALGLLKEGVNVFLAGRNLEKLEKTRIEAINNNYKGLTIIVKCDVSKEIDVKNLFNIIEDNFNRIDLLFNNAGVGLGTNTIDKIHYEDWKKVIDININGMFLCAKYAYVLMLKQLPKGGRIINNGSISAFTPRPGTSPYTTSKHAITGLTKSIALDGRNYDILCSQIDIGNAETELTKSFKEGVIQSNGLTMEEATMDASHVADVIITIFKLPLSTNILNLTIMANRMPYVGRG